MSTETVTPPVSPENTPVADAEKKASDTSSDTTTKRYDMADIKGRATRAEKGSAGITDAEILACVAAVITNVSALDAASGQIGAAEVDLAAAKTAWTPVLESLVLVLEPIAALLIRGIRGGDAFYRRCRNGHDPWITASKIVAQLPPGFLGLPAETVNALTAAVTAAKPAHDALIDARTAKVDAGKDFTRTKGVLSGSIVLLNARVAILKAQQRYGSTPAPIPVATPVTGSGGKATNATTSEVNGTIHATA